MFLGIGQNIGRVGLGIAKGGASSRPPVTIVARVTGLTATAGDGEITLNWDTVSNATDYVITTGTTTYNMSVLNDGETSNTTYNHTGLTNGKKRFYKVLAKASDGTTGDLSATVSATPVAPPTIVAQVTGLTATAGDGEITLNWDTVSNATDYVITTGTTTYNMSVLNDGETSNTTYNHTGLTNGKKRFYKVLAKASDGTTGDLSATVSATPVAPPTIVAQVTGLTATVGDGEITLNWDTVSNAHSYSLFKGTNADGSDSRSFGASIETSYYLNDLTNGQELFFQVMAIAHDRTIGDLSVIVSATPVAPPTVVEQVTGLTATVGDGEITLNWDTVSNAHSYTLFKGTNADGSDSRSFGATIETSYYLNGLTNGQELFFQVMAIAHDRTIGDLSVTVSATPMRN